MSKEDEEGLCRSEEENQGHSKLRDAVFQPEVRLHRADVQQLLVSKVQVPPQQQQWSPGLDQEDPPEPPHIKEEQEELWTSQEGEQLPELEEAETKFPFRASSLEVPPEHQQWSPRLDQEDPPESPLIKEEQEDLWTSQEGEQLPGLEEDEITKFPFTPVPVKSEEDDEEKPQSSQLHQRLTEENRDAEHKKIETDVEDCEGPEPARNFDPDSPLQPDTHDKTSLCSESETDDSCDWEETRDPQPGFSKAFSCSVCKKSFSQKIHLVQHTRRHTGEKPFSCSVCGKRFAHKGNLTEHLRVHTGERPFSCSVCGKTFAHKGNLNDHLRVHTGEKPFSCSVCGKTFAHKGNLNDHLPVHAEEKPFSCSVCGKRFPRKKSFSAHMKLHSDGKPFSCSVCKTSFSKRPHLVQHMRIHTGEKPFSCSECGKKFARKEHLRVHLPVHAGEKPFSCSVCGKRFSQKGAMRRHLKVHTRETI